MWNFSSSEIKKEQKTQSNYGSEQCQFWSKQSDEFEEYDAKTALRIQVCVNKNPAKQQQNEPKQQKKKHFEQTRKLRECSGGNS